MPHRVTTFLRNSSTSIEAQVANIKKATGRRPSPKPPAPSPATTAAHRQQPRETHPDQRPLSYASSAGGDDTGYASSHEGAVHEISTPRTSQSSNASPAPTTHTTTAMPQQRTASAERRDLQQQHHHHHHRLSFGALHFGRSSRESHANPNLTIDWRIESPPIVLYGDAEASTGALVSGLLFLTVKDEPVQLEAFAATLHMHVTQKRPYTAHCTDCIHQYRELRRWTFLQAPITLARGQHGFPFSVLLPGDLPASMDGQLTTIAYEFAAEATPAAGGPAIAAAAPVKFDRLFNVLRALPAPELPHHSVRIFPPTNIKASVHFPQVIYPLGQYTFSLRLDGVARLNEKASTVEYWKLKKLTWRLEETTKTIAPACARHAPRDTTAASGNSSSNLSLSDEEAPAAAATVAAAAAAAAAAPAATPPVAPPAETGLDITNINNINNHPSAAAAAVDPGVAAHEASAAAAAAAAAANAAALATKKAVQRKDSRVIGEKTLVTGWKSHYGQPDESLVEIELEYALGRHARYSCDTRIPADGTEVSHQLMVEMVVSQEWAPVNKPSMVTQTGVGRILRMHFNVVLTERGGIGISWDNEAPPIYQDVPPSPPSYREETGSHLLGTGSSNSPAAVPDMEPLDGVAASQPSA